MVADPPVRILTGHGATAVEIVLPKVLLCQSSSYFRNVLEGKPRDVKECVLLLYDEQAEVIQTFAAWLFEARIDVQHLGDVIGFGFDLEAHLLQVHNFAERRGIPSLRDAVVTAFAGCLCTFPLDPRTIAMTYQMDIKEECGLFRLFVDDETARDWNEQVAYQDYPAAFLAAVLLRSRVHMDLNDGGGSRPLAPAHHVCDYHEHGEGVHCMNPCLCCN